MSSTLTHDFPTNTYCPTKQIILDMKKILVPIDFSKYSLNALEYGIHIANKLQADLRIIHVKSRKNTYRYMQNSIDTVLKNTEEDWMEDILANHKSQFIVKDKEFDYCIREGNILQEITNQAKYDGTTIIVVGSHGASGIEDKWIGSNAYKLVHTSTVPVLTIRPGRKWNKMTKMVIPITNSKDSIKKIPAAIGLAKIFETKVCILGILENNYNLTKLSMKARIRQTIRFIESNTSLEVSSDIIHGSEKAEMIMKFANENNVDIIASNVHHSTNPFENILNPFANQLINKSECPVFTIPTKDSLYLHAK